MKLIGSVSAGTADEMGVRVTDNVVTSCNSRCVICTSFERASLLTPSEAREYARLILQAADEAEKTS